jgi:hypothetical protein
MHLVLQFGPLRILITTNRPVLAWLPPIPDRLVLSRAAASVYSIARPLMHHFTRRSRGGGERGEMHPIDWITGSIIDSDMRIHSAQGPGTFRVGVRGSARAMFEKQLQSYLVLTDCRVALLIHFKETHRKHGIKRIVNRLRGSPTALRFPACPA